MICFLIGYMCNFCFEFYSCCNWCNFDFLSRFGFFLHLRCHSSNFDYDSYSLLSPYSCSRSHLLYAQYLVLVFQMHFPLLAQWHSWQSPGSFASGQLPSPQEQIFVQSGKQEVFFRSDSALDRVCLRARQKWRRQGWSSMPDVLMEC